MTVQAKPLAVAAIAISCVSLVVASWAAGHQKALPAFTVTASTIHVWNGTTDSGEQAVCINGFAYKSGAIFDDSLLVPITGVRADDVDGTATAYPMKAVRCAS